MTGIFLGYLKIGFWLAFAMGGALLLLPRLSGRYSARLPYAVWLVLALRLLCPWGLEVPGEAVPIRLETQGDALWTPALPDTAAGAGNWDAARLEWPAEAPAPVEKAEKPELPPLPEVLAAAWLLGAACMAARFAWHSAKLGRLLGRWSRLPGERLDAFYAALAGGRRPPLMVCPALESPMAAGLFSPKIYLPREDYSEAELEMILRHELIHCRRRDIWYKLALFGAQCLHWYNPLVHLMVRQAHKDLEISCDAEAVRGQDAAYRKAYGQMILREAEHALERHGLNTCFVDGKRTLKERLREILDGGARKRGLPLLAAALLFAAGAGCAVKESGGGLEPPLSAEEVETVKAMAESWAEALSLRDGKIRYDMMDGRLKGEFAERQAAVQGEDWNYNIGGSSPWVNSYEVTLAGDTATIVYEMQDSIPEYYEMIEILKFGKVDGAFAVTENICSSLRQEGKPMRGVSGYSDLAEHGLDQGIFELMRESVLAVFEQVQWSRYELDSFWFEIHDVQKRALANGREEVTVDFILKMDYRNPFCNPDEVEEIRNARESGSPDYGRLYREYYQSQSYENDYRFVCQTTPGAVDVTEETCFPETFRLYENDQGAGRFSFADKEPAAHFLWDSLELGGISKMAEENDVLVEPQLWAEDTRGRTKNGYFVLNIGNTEGLTVAEDAAIELLDGDGYRTVGRAEWMEILKQAGSNAGKSYSVETRWEDGDLLVSHVREVARG